jgi:hypothetical protein
LLRYIFLKNGGSTLTRTNFVGKDLKFGDIKDGQSRVYFDYVSKELYYYRNSNTSKNICFFDYDGVLLKNISFAERNIGAMTVFGDFLYLQTLETRVVREMNVSTGVVYRNISLPKPLARLNDLAIVEQSQYPTGEMKQTFLCDILKIINENYYSNLFQSQASSEVSQDAVKHSGETSRSVNDRSTYDTSYN